jgi:hypothetical protein
MGSWHPIICRLSFPAHRFFNLHSLTEGPKRSDIGEKHGPFVDYGEGYSALICDFRIVLRVPLINYTPEKDPQIYADEHQKVDPFGVLRSRSMDCFKNWSSSPMPNLATTTSPSFARGTTKGVLILNSCSKGATKSTHLSLDGN